MHAIIPHPFDENQQKVFRLSFWFYSWRIAFCVGICQTTFWMSTRCNTWYIQKTVDSGKKDRREKFLNKFAAMTWPELFRWHSAGIRHSLISQNLLGAQYTRISFFLSHTHISHPLVRCKCLWFIFLDTSFFRFSFVCRRVSGSLICIVVQPKLLLPR